MSPKRQTVTSVGDERRLAPRWGIPVALVGLFVLLPLFEVTILILTGRVIGALWIILILLAEAALGAWLLKREGSKTWRQMRNTVKAGKAPGNELLDAALVGTGGFLLLLPGFLTDIVGIFCLLPWTRPLVRTTLAWAVNRYLSKVAQPVLPILRQDGVIEGSVIEGKVTESTSTSPSEAGPVGRRDRLSSP